MNHESLHQPPEHKAERAELAGSAERANTQVELSPQKIEAFKHSQHEKLMHARQEIKEIALEPVPDFNEKPEPKPITKREKLQLYKLTLRHVQQELPGQASRIFSKFIHQPGVEKVSDITARTLFRPSLSLGVALGAMLGGTMVYVTAKRYGFPISGTEFILFGILGGLAGLGGEGAKTLWRKVHR